MKLNAARCFLGACHRETHQRNIRDKRLKWTKHIVTFKEEKDEHILVEEGPQIECDTVFHRDTSHREFHPRNIRAKRLPREACFDQGDVKVVKEGGPQIERGMVFLRDTCHFFFFTETLVASDCRVKGALTRAMSKRREPL